jgi:hypothetical protein
LRILRRLALRRGPPDPRWGFYAVEIADLNGFSIHQDLEVVPPETGDRTLLPIPHEDLQVDDPYIHGVEELGRGVLLGHGGRGHGEGLQDGQGENEKKRAIEVHGEPPKRGGR